MAVDFSVLNADPNLTPHQVLEALADLLDQMHRDQTLADALLRGMGAFLSADANTDVTFPTDPVTKVPSIAKLYKAYADAIATKNTVAAAVSADIIAQTLDTVTVGRAAIATDRKNAQDAISIDRTAAQSAISTDRAAALASLATSLTAALKNINDLYTQRTSNFGDTFNQARNTINGLIDTQAQFVATARTGAEAARDLAQRWADSDLEVTPGRRSAKYWADRAAAVSDVTVVQAQVRKIKTRLFLGFYN